MNSNMYLNPITKFQLKKLKIRKFRIIKSIKKLLACGDYGIGAMESIENITKILKNHAK